MRQYDVYGVGNALVDMEYEVPVEALVDLGVDKGIMTLIDQDKHHEMSQQLDTYPHHKACGGSAANSMIALSQLGGSGYYSCKIANDDTGLFYLKDLKAAGISTNIDANDLDEGNTGKCLVMVTPDADRSMNTYLGITGDLSEREINADAIADSEYVYIEGYLVAADKGFNAALHAKQLADQSGVKSALSLSDPNIVTFFRERLLEIIGDGLDLIFCNEAELYLMTECNELEVAAEKMKQYAKTFAITLGPKGALLFDGERFIEIPAHAVKAVDTNGAGDMYAGTFLYGITRGMPFSRAGELASLAASRLVTHYGPRLPSHETEALLKEFNTMP